LVASQQRDQTFADQVSGAVSIAVSALSIASIAPGLGFGFGGRCGLGPRLNGAGLVLVARVHDQFHREQQCQRWPSRDEHRRLVVSPGVEA
jgi:hypothetical protein